MNVDAGTEAVESFDLLFTNLGGDRHDGMIRVELFDPAGEVFDLSVDGGIGGFFESFHFVAKSPEEEGRMIFVFFNGREKGLGLVDVGIPISVAEAMAFVAEPEAEGDLDSLGVGIVENGLSIFIDAPGSHRISSVVLESFQASTAANPMDFEGFSLDQQGGFFPFLLNGHLCAQKRNGKQEGAGEQGKDFHSRCIKLHEPTRRSNDYRELSE